MAARSVTPDAGAGGIVERSVAAEWESRTSATEECVLCVCVMASEGSGERTPATPRREQRVDRSRSSLPSAKSVGSANGAAGGRVMRRASAQLRIQAALFAR